jgi:signal transduction histidine kinase
MCTEAVEGPHSRPQVAQTTDFDAVLTVSPAAAVDNEEPSDLFERVERAKKEWEATVDSLSELICLLDEDGRVRRANRTVEMWGLALVTQVEHLPLHQLLHPNCEDLFCAIRQFVDRVIRSAGLGQPIKMETYDTQLNRWLRISAHSVPERQSCQSSTIVVIHDITATKQSEDALRRYAGRLEAMNAIGRAILAARSPEEVARAAFYHIRRLIAFKRASIMLYIAATDEYLLLEADANGSVHMWPSSSTSALALTNGSPQRKPDRTVLVADLAALSDLSESERQLVNEDLRSYISSPLIADGQYIGSLRLASQWANAFHPEHAEIVREVADWLAIATHQAQLYRKLQQANALLQEALQSKEEMIQNVSHELRTPLGLVYGYTSLLEEGDLGPITTEQAQALDIMRRQEERLRFMVDRLVILRLLDHTALELMPLNMREWLPAVIGSWEKYATRSKVELQVEVSPSVPVILASPDYLKHVFENLLDNAIKFSPNGGSVRVRVCAEAEQIVISVQDHGIGIPLHKIKQVFQRFYQIDGSATRHFGGMGIGLALCDEIVTAHGGCIWVESPGEGQGSTFFVALPITRAAGEGGGD